MEAPTGEFEPTFLGRRREVVGIHLECSFVEPPLNRGPTMGNANSLQVGIGHRSCAHSTCGRSPDRFPATSLRIFLARAQSKVKLDFEMNGLRDGDANVLLQTNADV